MARMQRTQLYLEPELAASLDRIAQERGTSRAALLREAAWRLVAGDETPETDSILGIIGIGRSGSSDGSLRHDEYLAQFKLEKMSR
jgi:metal-responsive CopG/Arc/MetJ family transcriptional regulator